MVPFVNFDKDLHARPRRPASGGAIYIRDPHQLLVDEQLNGGEFVDRAAEDWDLILPYLEENERLFGISIEEDLLTVDGQKKAYTDVYRKARPVKIAALATTAFSEGEDEVAEAAAAS